MANLGSTILFHVLVGAALGCAFGLAESIAVALAGNSVYGIHAHFPIAAFYTFVWALAGVGVALASAITAVVSLGPREEPRRRATWATVQILLSLLVSIGVALNVRYLPGFQALRSLLVDAALVVALALAFRPLRAALERRWRRRRGSIADLAVPIVLATGVFLLTLIPYLGGKGRSAAGDSGNDATVDRAPNVLLLAVDALRASQTSPYGHPLASMPHFDRFARDAVLFENMIAQSSRTKESTASMLTGTVPATHGMMWMTSAVPEDLPTIPEVLSGAGYATGIFTANSYLSPLFGFDRGVDIVYCPRKSVITHTLLGHVMGRLSRKVPGLGFLRSFKDGAADVLPSGSSGTTFEGEDARQINGAILDWIEEDPERSHFAYVHYMEPHAPYDPPAPFDILFDAGSRGGKVKLHPDLGEIRFPYGEAEALSERDLRNILALYDGEIASWDDAFGGLLRGLEQLGVLDDTIILVTADHGEEFYEHLAWGHGHSLYDEQIRVPLVARWPERIGGGRVEQGMVRHIDLFPTIVSLAGVPAERLPDDLPLQGASVAPALFGRTSETGVSHSMSEVRFGGHWARSLRTLSHKIVHCHTGGEETVLFFDLVNDPDEREDLSEVEAGAREALVAELARLHDGALSGAGEAREIVLDPETEARLRALGYLQ